jgi:tetratricopeptide (TPR) repeat protein
LVTTVSAQSINSMKPYLYRRLIPRLARNVQYHLALASLLICVSATIAASRNGLSRLLSEYGFAANSLDATQRAVAFNTADPAAHHALGIELANVGRNAEAVAELECAISLRPEDYFLWQELARLREDVDDTTGGIRALQHAIKLAPYYSEPHWQLGNLLLRTGEHDGAFSEMRRAVSSDAALFPLMTDLAWNVCRSDVKCLLTAATQPKDDGERLSLAHFFVAQRNIDAAVNLLSTAPKIESDERQEMVGVLIKAGEFRAAHKIWLAGRNSFQDDDVIDGGFERSMSLDYIGFGWSAAHSQTIQVLLDPNAPQSGRRSLLLKYAGNFDPTEPAISQLILVVPNAHYRLSFAARTEGLISGGLPVVIVKDAKDDGRAIAQSASLSPGTNDWKEFSIAFKTAATTQAITVNIQRESCTSNPCPIVGRANFDSFSLRRLKSFGDK